MIDVTAHNDHCPDLGAGPSESRQYSGQQAKTSIPEQCRHHPQAACTERLQLFLILHVQIGNCLAGQRSNDRDHQDTLSNHHRGRRVQDAILS